MAKRGMPMDAFRFWYVVHHRSNCMHMAQCVFHEDSNNDHRSLVGANKNFCFNQMINMMFPNRSNPVLGHCAMDQFMKECNGNVLEKYASTMKLAQKVREYTSLTFQEGSVCSNVDWISILGAVTEWAKDDGLDYTTITVNTNKDYHYSWYVHMIFTKIMLVYGWNYWVLIEALYCMSLTPSSI